MLVPINAVEKYSKTSRILVICMCWTDTAVCLLPLCRLSCALRNVLLPDARMWEGSAALQALMQHELKSQQSVRLASVCLCQAQETVVHIIARVYSINCFVAAFPAAQHAYATH